MNIKKAVTDTLALYERPNVADKGVLLRNLVFMWHTMRASESLLELAVKNTPDGVLRDFYIEHLEEERGHEQWLADDLATQGIDVTATFLPLHAVNLVGTQYYLLNHVDTAALIGYMAVMECFPIDEEALIELEKLHGKAILRTVRYHSTHDVGHGAKLLEVFEQLAPGQQLLAVESAIQSAHYLGAAIKAWQINRPTNGDTTCYQ